MVKVKFVGHACFLIEGEKHKLVIDPFIYGNPVAQIDEKELEGIEYILVTHGHGDHLGDAIKLYEKYNAKVVCIYDLAVLLSGDAETIGMNKGGTLIVDDTLKITMLNAVHSSSVRLQGYYYAGDPASFLIEIDGKKIFHAGDSAIMADYEIYGEIFGPIDLALLPIGGFFTMDVKQAYYTAKMLKAKAVIPMHYNTFDPIKVKEEDLRWFKESLEKEGIKVYILNPGQEIEI